MRPCERSPDVRRRVAMPVFLSAGLPQVRVDLYEVGGKPYFGEMTFTGLGGYMNFFTEEFLLELGDYTKLPKQ